MPPVRVSSGGESGWGEAGMYGPPEPVAAAIKVQDVVIMMIVMMMMMMMMMMVMPGCAGPEDDRRGAAARGDQ